jgi:pantoate--beta-alanine ligase
MTDIVNAEPLAKIDYIKIVSLDTMQQITEFKDSALVAMAVYIGKTRLIDNYFYEGE